MNKKIKLKRIGLYNKLKLFIIQINDFSKGKLIIQ